MKHYLQPFTWPVRMDRSSWLALLVRGHYADKPEIIASHSSPVMVELEGSPFYAAADALTILEQIEGALVYLDTVGTRAETHTYTHSRLCVSEVLLTKMCLVKTRNLRPFPEIIRSLNVSPILPPHEIKFSTTSVMRSKLNYVSKILKIAG